ncbi:hypothetical protein B0A54_10241 [Friedmanniomyces endolithicus]|uniref:Uncharacterized protein n=1 Tax=Friedmanniomyces endolithicus TaxID=329885 RepID=A0A4U0UUZ4_9PEZI|nr:hypothetical protein B0A54_10241 [Friedmanniomyces endolithicus]
MTKRPLACACVGSNSGHSTYPYLRQNPDRPPMIESIEKLVDDTRNIDRADVAGLHIRFDQTLVMIGLLRDKLNHLHEDVQGLKQQQERTGRSEEKTEKVDDHTESESGPVEELHTVDQDDGVMSASPFSSTFSIATPETVDEPAEGESEPALSYPRPQRLSFENPVSPLDISLLGVPSLSIPPLSIPSLSIPPLAIHPPSRPPPGSNPRPAPGGHGAFTGYWSEDNWKYWPASPWMSIGLGTGNVEEDNQRIERQTPVNRAGSISTSGGGGGGTEVVRRRESGPRHGDAVLSGSLGASKGMGKSRHEQILAKGNWRSQCAGTRR